MTGKRLLLAVAALGACLGWMIPAEAAFVVEPRTGGKATANFGFGGDTTLASSSSADGLAPGLTAGIGSVFGGDGSAFDTYTYSYTPGPDADNTVYTPGEDLGNGNNATAQTGGASDTYNVYATWPTSDNVSGGLTTYSITADNGLVQLVVDQNQAATGLGDGWVLIGQADLTAGTTYVLTQDSTAATFVSMRSAGAMFERVPEPASLALLGLGGLLMLRRRTA